MSCNINSKDLERWLKRNYWRLVRSNKHTIWILQVFDEKTGEMIYFGGQITINLHRSKGQGVSDRAIKDIAKVMKIDKDELINLINNKKDIEWSHFLKK